MENEATLIIIFYAYYDNSIFNKFILNEESFDIETEKIVKNEKIKSIVKKYVFDKYEQDLGKKYCSYQLIPKDDKKINKDLSGSFEISPGDNIAYCFLDTVGMTYKLLFLQKKNKIKNFIKSKFTYNIPNYPGSNKEIELTLNTNGTEDRANLILINCDMNSQINKDGQFFIDLKSIEKKIENFDEHNGYQICYHFNNFKDFAYQRTEEIKQIKIADLYNNFHEEVEQMYEILNKIMNVKDENELKNLINDLAGRFGKIRPYLSRLIKDKFVYGKKILEEDINQEIFYDFAFKVLSLFVFEGTILEEEKIDINYLNTTYQRLLENKEKFEKDQLLKVHEKIFLLNDVYSSELLKEKDYILNYFHIKNIEINSPLFYAFEFLNKFIEELDYDSNFYYPLLSIDGGFYEYNHKKEHGYEYVSTHGFNMLSLNKIKEHLLNMIPNIIIWSKDLGPFDALTNPSNGTVNLNLKQFESIEIDKAINDENKSKHYAFIISKILVHELFGHKKSSFSKSGNNYNSIISFRNELGELIFINSNDSDNNNNSDKNKDKPKINLFSYSNEIPKEKNFDSLKGDSGYFIEYFFGKINNEYTIAVIDRIEISSNLSKLLNPELWHKDISTFKEYVKLKSIFFHSFPEVYIDNNLNLYDQIKMMKVKLNEEDKKIELKKSYETEEVKTEFENKINQMFSDSWKEWKKRKNIMKKKEDTSSINKDKNERGIDKSKKSLFAEFTHGFYRK